MTHRTVFITALVTLLWCLHANADVKMSVHPDRTRIAVGENMTVTVRIVSDKSLAQPPTPALASNDDFTVVRTNRNQSQNSSIQIVNGRMTQKVEISYFIYYQVLPQKVGTFTFPALSVTIDGETHTTQPFEVTVTREAVENPDVKVRLSASKIEPYAGEQFILTLLMAQKAQSSAQLTQQGVSDCIERVNKALSKDFSAIPLFSSQFKGAVERIDGEMYHVFRLNWALFPLGGGSFSIPSLPMDYVVQVRSQRRSVDPFFDDFFGGGVQQVVKTVTSNALTLRVRELPTPPADFSGAVGRFTLTASVDPKSIPAGEAVTLKMTLAGNTRPGSLNDPKMPRMDEFEVFTPEKQTAVDTTAQGVSSRRNYKYLIIPRKEGTISIPSISWVYFDPAAQAYKTLKTDPIALDVTKGSVSPKTTARYMTQADIREVGRDIRYIKTISDVKHQAAKPYLNPVLFILYPIPFLLSLFAFLFKVQASRQKDVRLTLKQKALHRAMREIDLLRKQGKALPGNDFLSRIAAVIERFISHKFDFPATGRTLEELRQELSTRGVDPQVVSQLVTFIQGMDLYRFGGVALDEKGKSDALVNTEDFIAKLAKASRKEGRV